MKIEIKKSEAEVEAAISKLAAQTIRDIEKFAKEHNLDPKEIALRLADSLEKQDVLEREAGEQMLRQAEAASLQEKR